MSIFVGVDGGGSRTRAVVLDENGAELGRAQAGGGVADPARASVAVEAVSAAVRRAAAAANVSLPVTALWAGLAGGGRRDARERVASGLEAEGLAATVRVGTDAEAAFHDAFADGPGVLLIAGTGSIAWGRAEDGTSHRVGGWGSRLGDEGSGYWIGLRALRRVVRAADGRDPGTDLVRDVPRACGVEGPRDLLAWTEAASKADVAGLAPTVAEAADRGDAAAAAIVDAAVEELDAHVAALLRSMPPGGAPVRIAVWGGLLAPGGPLRSRMLDALARRRVPVLDRTLDPPTGAARLAARLS